MKKLIIMLMFLLTPALAFTNTITAQFDYPEDTNIEGFRLYDNGISLCDQTDPTSRQMICEADLGFGAHVFTMTAFVGDEESEHSVGYPMVIKIESPELGNVEVK